MLQSPMEHRLSELQKVILRMALQNRETIGVTVEEVVQEHEIHQIDPDGTTTSEKYLARELKPSRKGWVDLEEPQVLREYFGITYTPTFEEEYGIVTAASQTVESRQYQAAEELVQDAIMDLPAAWAEQYFCGPSSWDGLPNRMSIMLRERGVELAKRLREEAGGGAVSVSDLEPETESRYRALLRKKGVPEEEMLPARPCQAHDRPAREIPVSFFVGLLEDRDPSKRNMGINGLRQIGGEAPEAIPALRKALDDPAPAIRLVASWALKEIEQNA